MTAQSLAAFWSQWWPLVLMAAIVLGLVAVLLVRVQRVRAANKARALRMLRLRQKKAAQPPKASPSASLVSDNLSREAPEHRPMILIANDSRAALQHAKSILEKQPYRVVLAENGRIAWGIMQEEKPDLVISDIDMPQLNGFQLLRLVREDLKLADLPFILMTNHLYTHVQSSQSAGFDSLLPMPYRPEDLVEQVRFLLQQ